MAILDPVKSVGATVKNNPIGAIGGGLAGFFLAKKYSPVKKTWMLIGIGVASAIAGAYIQSKVTAKVGSKKSANEAKK